MSGQGITSCMKEMSVSRISRCTTISVFRAVCGLHRQAIAMSALELAAFTHPEKGQNGASYRQAATGSSQQGLSDTYSSCDEHHLHTAARLLVAHKILKSRDFHLLIDTKAK